MMEPQEAFETLRTSLRWSSEKTSGAAADEAANWQKFRLTERVLWDTPLKDHYSAGYSFLLSEIAAVVSGVTLNLTEFEESLQQGEVVTAEDVFVCMANRGAIDALDRVVGLVHDILADVPMSLAREKLERSD